MSGQKIIDGLNDAIAGRFGRITEVLVPAVKMFPVPAPLLSLSPPAVAQGTGREPAEYLGAKLGAIGT
jgi:hypothetical protein